jgi:hypothetical protein
MSGKVREKASKPDAVSVEHVLIPIRKLRQVEKLVCRSISIKHWEGAFCA